MKRMLGISILVLLYAIYLGPHFPGFERIAINRGNAVSGIATINLGCAENLRPALAILNARLVGERLRFEQVESDEDVMVRIEDIGRSQGRGSPTHARIWLQRDLPAESVPKVLLHEILHCAGVGHMEAGNIMEPNLEESFMLTAEQIAALRGFAGTRRRPWLLWWTTNAT